MSDNAPRRVIIVDDEPDFLTTVRIMLKGKYVVVTAGSITEAISTLQETDVDLILLDVGLSGEDGIGAISTIRSSFPSIPVAMLSGRKDLKTVVRAIKAGAMEYLTKPLNLIELEETVEKAVYYREERDRLEARVEYYEGFKSGDIVYKSSKIKKIFENIEKLGCAKANVLITGESGTGKELMARRLNRRFGTDQRPLISVNCAAIPEELIESELFGHEAHAFTGARHRRIGKFELANRGDIFLDEIGSMKFGLQVKLLRVLQEGEFCRLGSNHAIRSDFRVISACNRPMEEMIDRGEFRLDLYHRLKTFELFIPPLRERVEDIPVLVNHFLGRFCDKDKKRRFSKGAMERFVKYPWPGNVRELSNVVQSLVMLSDEEIIGEWNFPEWMFRSGSNPPAPACNALRSMAGGSQAGADNLSFHGPIPSLYGYLREREREIIGEALRRNEGDRIKTAKALGVGRTTLYLKMKSCGLIKT